MCINLVAVQRDLDYFSQRNMDDIMKKRLVIISLILLAIIVSAAYAASDSSSSATSSSSSTTSSGTSASTSIDNSALVTVTNVVMNPEVFFPYEEGTITVTLANTGTSAIGLTNPTILSNKVHIVQQENVGTTTYIGAGSTVTYSFDVTADPPDGTDYALFTVSTRGRQSHALPNPSKVSSAPLKAVITSRLPPSLSQLPAT